MGVVPRLAADQTLLRNDLTAELLIRSIEHLLKHQFIQPNHQNSNLWLVFDIDRATCVDEITDDL